MLRIELERALERVTIATSLFVSIIRQFEKEEDRERRPGVDLGSILDAYHTIRETEKTFGPAERYIIDVFKIKNLFEAGFWEHLARLPPTVLIEQMEGFVSSCKQVTEFGTRFLKLLQRDFEQDVADEVRSGIQSGASQYATIFLAEDKGSSSTPKRITDSISGFTQLYEVLAELANAPPNDLALIGCDSGSDKSFDFLGAAALISELKTLLLEMFDKVVFFRYMQHAERMKQVSGTLSVVARIEEFAAAGKLSAESAEILKRKSIDGVCKLLDTGTTIPEMKTVANQDPRTLISAAPVLLLGGPTSDSSRASNVEHQSSSDLENEMTDGLTGEEQLALDALLKKRRQQ